MLKCFYLFFYYSFVVGHIKINHIVQNLTVVLVRPWQSQLKLCSITIRLTIEFMKKKKKKKKEKKIPQKPSIKVAYIPLTYNIISIRIKQRVFIYLTAQAVKCIRYAHVVYIYTDRISLKHLHKENQCYLDGIHNV